MKIFCSSRHFGDMLDLDLDTGNNCQSPEGYFGNVTIIFIFAVFDVFDRWCDNSVPFLADRRA